MTHKESSENNLTIYHNPRCSKSCETLNLLESQGETPIVVEYLRDPLNEVQLQELLSLLGVPAHEIVRSGEKEYQELGLSKDSIDSEIVAAIARYPNLMQRPIVVKDSKAAIGRPIEKIRALLQG